MLDIVVFKKVFIICGSTENAYSFWYDSNDRYMYYGIFFVRLYFGNSCLTSLKHRLLNVNIITFCLNFTIQKTVHSSHVASEMTIPVSQHVSQLVLIKWVKYLIQVLKVSVKNNTTIVSWASSKRKKLIRHAEKIET